jgi:hypothetical protein
VTDLFRPGPEGRAVAIGRPSFLDDLAVAGFDPGLLDAGHAAWAGRRPLVDLTRAEANQ